MTCKNTLGHLAPCDITGGPTIENASKMSGIELSKPIDLSQMRVNYIRFMPIEHMSGKREFEREVELFGHEQNADGEMEEIIITIVRKSTKLPKI